MGSTAGQMVPRTLIEVYIPTQHIATLVADRLYHMEEAKRLEFLKVNSHTSRWNGARPLAASLFEAGVHLAPIFPPRRSVRVYVVLYTDHSIQLAFAFAVKPDPTFHRTAHILRFG